VICYDSIDADKAFEAICDAYQVQKTYELSFKSVDFTEEKRKTDFRLIQISDDIVISCHPEFSALTVMHTHATTEEELRKIDSLIEPFGKARYRHKLSLLTYQPEMGEFRLREFTMQESEMDIDLHYNDDFKSIHELILGRLSEPKSKGIVLLHGVAGTGKTSYIRHLTRHLNKKLIYIPSSLAHRLGDPEFLPFLERHAGSILIIEDAEDILQERKGGDNGTIANLLNLGDGLLSDCLNLQIICTFNAPLTRIDKALLRKGRLIASYEFKALSVCKTNQLLSYLGLEESSSAELTLAEIFYRKDREFMGREVREVGFGR
jgi:hypothetical protein